jgi:hypothetical protein
LIEPLAVSFLPLRSDAAIDAAQSPATPTASAPVIDALDAWLVFAQVEGAFREFDDPYPIG